MVGWGWLGVGGGLVGLLDGWVLCWLGVLLGGAPVARGRVLVGGDLCLLRVGDLDCCAGG